MISKTLICTPEEFDAKYEALELEVEKSIRIRSNYNILYSLKDNPTIHHHGNIHYIQFVVISINNDYDD